jgi:hypothetical protein
MMEFPMVSTLPDQNAGQSFAVQDCALAAIATGRRARNLHELREGLAQIHPESIYYHFWGGLLRPRFDDPEYHNDFAIWSRYALQDAVLAERLGIIDPVSFSELDMLRHELLEVIDGRLNEVDTVPVAKSDKQFYFVRCQTVVFDTGRRVTRPEELAQSIPFMSLGSIFLHFIDARQRTPDRIDDFSAWLRPWFRGHEDLCDALDRVDPFFSGLTALRARLTDVFHSYFGK